MTNTNNNSNEQRQQQNCQYSSKQSFNNNNNNNSRKEVIKALLNLLIWHHPETKFTENMNPSEIHTFHIFLLNWLTKTDCLQTIPMNINTNMYVAQFSRRILTHLIRILYSDTVYEEETTIDDGQTIKDTEDEEDTMNVLTNEKEDDGINNNSNLNEFNQSLGR